MSEQHNWPDMPDFTPDSEPEGTGEAFDYNTIIGPPVSAPEPEPEAPEIQHRRKGGVEQSYCELCDKWYSKKWLYAHRRKVHGIYGGKSGRGRVRGPNKPKRTLEIDQVVDHKPHKLPPLSAEQITRAAAEALWPKGIPHDALTALLRWNIQTHYFLAEVTQ